MFDTTAVTLLSSNSADASRLAPWIPSRPVREPNMPAQAYDIVGPICETGDTFARNRMLAPQQDGDLVAFMTAGAYGASMASTYNARALIAEVLVKGDRFELVRRRWSVEEQMALEHAPDWS